MELIAFEILLIIDDLEDIEDNKFLFNLKALEDSI